MVWFEKTVLNGQKNTMYEAFKRKNMSNIIE